MAAIWSAISFALSDVAVFRCNRKATNDTAKAKPETIKPPSATQSALATISLLGGLTGLRFAPRAQALTSRTLVMPIGVPSMLKAICPRMALPSGDTTSLPWPPWPFA